MIPHCLLIGSLGLLSLAAQPGHSSDRWQAFRFLIGDWTGEGGSGSTGQGSGEFSFRLDAGGQVLMRRNTADYPAAAGKPALHHEDLMMIYSEAGEEAPEALYVDGEGHVIHYLADSTSPPSLIRFTSRAAANSPRYRLTYRQTGAGTLSGQFEMAPPGKPEAFISYMTWTAKRK